MRGSDLWRSAAISAGVAFAATMVIGSISEAAKTQRAPSDAKLAETAQAKTAESVGLKGKTIEASESSRVAVSEGVDPLNKLQVAKEVTEKSALSPSSLLEKALGVNKNWRPIEGGFRSDWIKPPFWPKKFPFAPIARYKMLYNLEGGYKIYMQSGIQLGPAKLPYTGWVPTVDTKYSWYLPATILNKH